ncbi:MAG: hypothetical protein EXS10_05915 [Phycisphaerales bacterium]|nr:hypothetical protein [Phycisphaerales bacterium]
MNTQPNQSNRFALRTIKALAALALVVGGATGCSPVRLSNPVILQSPYPEERVWAVVPFGNESGVSIVDGAAVADRFVEEAEGVDGLRCLPVNRTIAAMKSLGMTGVFDRQQASTLMRTLQADGLVLGTVTTYDPYKPLRLGIAVELISGSPEDNRRPIDLRELTMPTSESFGTEGTGARVAMAQASRLFDARGHDTMAELDVYTMGRTEQDGSFGNRAYETRMDLFARFASYVLIRDLLHQEGYRINPEIVVGQSE